MKEKSIILFNQKTIRRHWDKKKELWYFSVIDIIEVLTQSSRPKKYWNDLKIKLQQEERSQLSAKIGRLRLKSTDGRCSRYRNNFKTNSINSFA